MTRYAYSGEPGAFAEDAVLAFDPTAEAVPTPGFREVFEAVVAGRRPDDPADAPTIERGVLPIENVVQGTVRETYDLLLEHDLVIVGEVIVPVHLCLAALPGERLESIERVYSHIQALGQAEAFLRSRPWSLLTTYNTAGAGKLIVDRQERGAAAVLSPRAAAGFGLQVLADEIQTVPENRTRFLVVARPGSERTLALPDAGGAIDRRPRGPSDDPGPGRQERARLAPALPGGAGGGRPEHGQAGVTPESRSGVGVRLLGRARRRCRRSDDDGSPRCARARRLDGPRARFLPEGRRPRLTSGGAQWMMDQPGGSSSSSEGPPKAVS